MGIIKIKKRVTFERGVWSKALVVYGLEAEANRIDIELVTQKYKGFKYISHERSNSQQRITAMYYNNMINIKARYEILFNANVEDEM